VFISLLPYGLLLGRIFKNERSSVVMAESGASRRSQASSKNTEGLNLKMLTLIKPPTKAAALSAAAAFFFALSAVAFFAWHDPGIQKSGNVLVDEYHSDWEWTDEAYDENWFGERSGYNYYCFYEYISKFYHAARNEEPITAAILENVDVLILKTPTMPYEDSEVAAITEYARRGGSVYLIGDHTNVFGTSTNFNKLSKHFGIRFNYDCTYELTSGSLQEYDAPKLFQHPALQGMPHFLFATSCTLDSGFWAEDLMVGYGLKTLPADYSQKNFFPADTNNGKVIFGSFIQSAAVTFGKGRVLAYADSTVFSNFWMHMKGKPELLLRSIEWLNHRNSLPFQPRKAACAGLLFSLLFFVFGARAGAMATLSGHFASFTVRCISAGLAGLILATALFGIADATKPLPRPITDYVKIGYESEYSDIKLPVDLEGFLSDMDQLFSTFYVWNQRLGYVPVLEGSLEDALSNNDMAVLVKPVKAVTYSEIKKIRALVEGGAKLFILDNAEAGNSDKLLAEFGFTIDDDAKMAEFADYLDVTDIPLTQQAKAVKGGDPLILDRNGNAVMAVSRAGEGMVAVFTDPALFYNYEIGDVSANLTDKTRIITNLEFRIMKRLIEAQ